MLVYIKAIFLQSNMRSGVLDDMHENAQSGQINCFININLRQRSGPSTRRMAMVTGTLLDGPCHLQCRFPELGASAFYFWS